MLKKIQLTTFQRFLRTETVGGSILLLCAVVALVLANSPLATVYEQFWQIPITIGIVDHSLSLTLQQWINDALMAVFFLLVGLEIKRELLVGELASVKKAALPIACAIGGMIVPAAIYWMFNRTGIGARGWGVPMATDIAFALGTLALIAPRAPIGAKVFLTALAIVDDMGAVIVIAFFYSDAIALGALGGAAVLLLILIGFNAIRVRHLWPYWIVGIVFWYFVHASGIHGTVAGVLLAFTMPMYASEGVTAPILRLEHALHNFSAFVVMPLFAFANAGVRISGPVQHAAIGLGVMAGLIIGKPLGVTAAALAAVACETSQRPFVDVFARRRVAGGNRVHHVVIHRHARFRRRPAVECGKARHIRWLTACRHHRRDHSQDDCAGEIQLTRVFVLLAKFATRRKEGA